MVGVDVRPAVRRTLSRTLRSGRRTGRAPVDALRTARDWREFRRLEKAAGLPSQPVEPYLTISDRVATTSYDPHYATQGAWVLRGMVAERPLTHVDVGSLVDYQGFFAAVAPTCFIDIRPAGIRLPGLVEQPGSVLELPYPDCSVPSLSCLHVVEHVGLGRYGDPVDPAGFVRACAELARVTAPGGSLYVSTPVGRPRLCFPAHRVSAPAAVVAAVGLPLASFDLVGDDGVYRVGAELSEAEGQDYALGLFRFRG